MTKGDALVEVRVPRALLVRHCESTGPAPDAPLSARGEAQAVALAERLCAHPIDHIVSSPYARARGTIVPFAERTGLPVCLEPRLAERRLASELHAPGWREAVRRSFEDPHFRLPGGESGAEALARGSAAIREVLAAGHRLPVLVSHGQLLSLFLHSVDARFGYADWEALAMPDVFLLEERAGKLVFGRT
jgi:2,3-bisphosphoglycerate-dependent phosphoglycerate mutase